MRRVLLIASSALALAAAAACATSNVDAPEPTPNQPPEETRLPDGGSTDGESRPSRDGAVSLLPSCSDAGWCITTLPDEDLTFKDIWPFEHRAFALAESASLGTKVLEWNEADNEWHYIDDNTQNEYGSGQYASTLWAPNENEVYYGVAPAFIYHGQRTTPSSPWTWSRSRLDDNSRDTSGRDHGLAWYSSEGAPPAPYAALGVWGTSANDVYAWYANTIFRLVSEEGGAPSWVADHILDDTENQADTFFVFGANAWNRDDVWFVGGRARHDATGTYSCPLAIHKTPDGYRVVVDHAIAESDPTNHDASVCQQRADAVGFKYGFPFFPGMTFPWSNSGYLTSITAVGPGEAVGVLGGSMVGYVSAQDGGSAMMNMVEFTPPKAFPPSKLNSIWVHDAQAWISGWGFVLRTDGRPDAFRSGPHLTPETAPAQFAGTTFRVSTVARGGPLDAPLYQVRGTSNTNVWAIGPRYALHKTTP